MAVNAVGITSFYDLPLVKNILAVLRLANNLSDDYSFYRCALFLGKDIGKKTIDTLRDFAHSEDVSMTIAVARASEACINAHRCSISIYVIFVLVLI
ncbi:hypothetical protein ATZ36_14935 [Candidatus Endomicrobiellum trichonymphae]|uniref:UvrD-like helicase C-terminal domain-containing protein n=1 Tax=Endomicrobium trichonymphae TaxID=1408204 RepID=A0A1E5ILP8_ENDTX|nr:hypothetical protein ATZ36_14935 [Candidatus Endomicrobium trichonymphae]